MNSMLTLLLLFGAFQTTHVEPDPSASIFERGRTMDQFVASVTVQRELWQRNLSWTDMPPHFVQRLLRVSRGLRVLIVAEDWCPDSVNTVPYIARLASLAGVEVRIVGRAVGGPLMARYRTPDGRTATPIVILLRDGIEAGAWVERPRVLQELFESMRTNPESGRRLAERQTWYDADHGETTLSELVSLAERTSRK